MALRLFSAAGTAFLVGVLGIALSGGGLGPRGSLPEPVHAALVVVTWIAWLVLLPLLAAASVAAVVAIVTPPARTNSSRARGRRVATAKNGRHMAWAGQPNALLAVLLVMAVGGVLLFMATAQRPSLDYVPLGIVLLALGVVALLSVLRSRLATSVRNLNERRRTMP